MEWLSLKAFRKTDRSLLQVLPREFLQKRFKFLPHRLFFRKNCSLYLCPQDCGSIGYPGIKDHLLPRFRHFRADQPHIAQKLRFSGFPLYRQSIRFQPACQFQIMAHLGERLILPQYLSDQAFHDLRKLFLHFICRHFSLRDRD